MVLPDLAFTIILLCLGHILVSEPASLTIILLVYAIFGKLFRKLREVALTVL